jgi:hypothetical protein
MAAQCPDRVWRFTMTCIVAVAMAGMGLCANSRAADEPAGFERPLFDGTSLDGWTIENDCQVAVEEGEIVLKAGNGWLRSDHTYADCRLHVEWKAVKATDYDAGVYVRTLMGGAPFPKSSYQINLLEGSEGHVKNIKGAVTSGLVRKGEWNAFDIAALGETLALAINGRPAYKVNGLKNPAGYLGLQCEVPKGGEFRFRNLRVVEPRHRSLFNGRDLAGWQGADEPAENCWEVDRGLLICNGRKGPWLRSSQQYADFNLRLDYMVSAGGNSGVYVRVPEDGNHHREDQNAPAAGFEVQILDDADPQHANLKEYQYSASIYDIAGADPRVSKPPGSWNTLEINCNKLKVTVTHNGRVVADIDEKSHPLIALRETRGFLGLQNHSTRVSFRHLRLGPPL